MKPLLILIFVALVLCGSAKADNNDPETIKKLGGITVNLRWENVDVQEALDDLATQSKKIDPDHVGIRFSLSLPASDNKPNAVASNVRRNVSIVLSGVTILDALRYLNSQTNLYFKAQKNKVIVLPKEPGVYVWPPLPSAG